MLTADQRRNLVEEIALIRQQNLRGAMLPEALADAARDFSRRHGVRKPAWCRLGGEFGWWFYADERDIWEREELDAGLGIDEFAMVTAAWETFFERFASAANPTGDSVQHGVDIGFLYHLMGVAAGPTDMACWALQMIVEREAQQNLGWSLQQRDAAERCADIQDELLGTTASNHSLLEWLDAQRVLPGSGGTMDASAYIRDVVGRRMGDDPADANAHADSNGEALMSASSDDSAASATEQV